MFMNMLRGNRYAGMILTLFRLYLGYEWTKAGWHKIKDGFDAAGYLKGAIAKPVLESGTQARVYPHFVGFLEHVALPNVKLINVVVPWGELLVGIGLLLGALTTAAVFFGMVMNFTYIFAGTVSENPWYVLFGIFVIAAGANAGRLGLDYFILPWLRGRRQQIMGTLGNRKKTNGRPL